MKKMKKNLITIAYNGTNFYGWQKQENGPTIQSSVEDALKKLFSYNIEIRGSSRTDAGVHAIGQRAVFFHEHTIPMENVPLALNNFLPQEIRILKCEEVDFDFHPQYDAKNKTYKYRIYNKRIMNPLEYNLAWHVNKYLDICKIKNASKSLLGTHDFSAFCAVGSNTKTKIRHINYIDIERIGDIVEIIINGDGFLYNMVRIIAGTLAYVGYGKLREKDVYLALESKDRSKAGITAPACGLTLVQVNY